MREKITLDQFREIKQQLREIIERGESNQNDELIIDVEEEEQQLENQYFNNFINIGNKIDIYVKK